jgi:YD repeat-containing protein
MSGPTQLKVAAISIATVLPSVAQQFPVYDRVGNPAGSATVRGNTASTYDRNGQLESTGVRHGNFVTWTNRDGSRVTYKSIKRGNTTLIYHSNGQLHRKVIKNSDGTSTVYDENGNVLGSGR